jgi:hypothetical protein
MEMIQWLLLDRVQVSRRYQPIAGGHQVPTLTPANPAPAGVAFGYPTSVRAKLALHASLDLPMPAHRRLHVGSVRRPGWAFKSKTDNRFDLIFSPGFPNGWVCVHF